MFTRLLTLMRFCRVTWASRPSRLSWEGPSREKKSSSAARAEPSFQPLFGSKALKEAPPSDWEGAPLMGMVPVGGWETQKGSEHSAHGARQLFAREAYKSLTFPRLVQWLPPYCLQRRRASRSPSALLHVVRLWSLRSDALMT